MNKDQGKKTKDKKTKILYFAILRHISLDFRYKF